MSKHRKCYSCHRHIGTAGRPAHCTSPTCDYCAACYQMKWRECKGRESEAS